jgi:hypothetical protein
VTDFFLLLARTIINNSLNVLSNPLILLDSNRTTLPDSNRILDSNGTDQISTLFLGLEGFFSETGGKEISPVDILSATN